MIINPSIGEDLAPSDAWTSVHRRSPRKYTRKNWTFSLLYVASTRKVCVQFVNRLRIMFINRMNYFARTLFCCRIFGELQCEYDNISERYYFCSRFVCEQLAKYFKIEAFKVDVSKSGVLKIRMFRVGTLNIGTFRIGSLKIETLES